jgi:hypothetical protein
MQIVMWSDGYLPKYRHLTSKFDRNSFCLALFLCQGNSSPDGIMFLFFCTRETGNMSLNSFWQVMLERDARWWSTINTRCSCCKISCSSTVGKKNLRPGAGRLQHGVTCVGCCTVTAILRVYYSKRNILNCLSVNIII